MLSALTHSKRCSVRVRSSGAANAHRQRLVPKLPWYWRSRQGVSTTAVDARYADAMLTELCKRGAPAVDRDEDGQCAHATFIMPHIPRHSLSSNISLTSRYISLTHA